MAQYKFVVADDLVAFYDGSQLVVRLLNTARNIYWYYESQPGIKFEIDRLVYNALPEQIEIDGVTLTQNSEFDAAILAIFPNLTGDAPGIDGIEVVDDVITITGEVDIVGNLEVSDGLGVNGDDCSINTATVRMQNLPTSDPGNEGHLWNDAGTLKISAG